MLARLWYDFEDNSHIKARECFMNIISKRASDAFGKRIGDWCQSHGVMYIGHVIEDNGAHRSTGYGLGHFFRSVEGQHMSGVDIVLHQLMPGLTEVSSAGSTSYREMDNKLYHYVLGKLASSSAHIDPKKQGRAMCELFGAFGWAEDTGFMKYLIDHFMLRGINYYVPHAFSPKKDDTDCPPNFYNTGKNPQFKYFGMLMDYINRMCALTDGATHIPTAAVIYDAEASWSIDICKETEFPKFVHHRSSSELFDVTGADELPSFTGNIKYSTKVILDANKNKTLDLGSVGTTAEVKINGIHVGTRIFQPYRFDISDAVKDGENTIEVLVTNTCVFEQRDKFSRFMAIRPSGILGPVKI